jgi:hypothetical protein
MYKWLIISVGPNQHGGMAWGNIFYDAGESLQHKDIIWLQDNLHRYHPNMAGNPCIVNAIRLEKLEISNG